MYEPYLVWAGLALLAVLCQPIAGVQKLVLEASAWTLRLALLVLLGAAGYLWFRPADLPAEVTGALSRLPRVLSFLPDPTAPAFGACVIAPLAAALLPLLAVLDTARQLAGRRLRAVTREPSPDPVVPPAPVPAVRRIDRREAAAAMTAAARTPDRAAGRLTW